MSSNKAFVCAVAIFAAMGAGTAAHAEMPVFAAKCLSNDVDADRTGTVRINGLAMDVRKFNENYYEASHESLTISIANDAGNLIVSYTGSGGANGMCTVLTSGSSQGSGVAEPFTGTERVQFKPGTSGAELWERLTPGSSMRYVLGARNGQFLDVEVVPEGPDIYYQIFNPDGTFLLDQISSEQTYRGQLWQSGDHVIEVINRGNADESYNVIFRIE